MTKRNPTMHEESAMMRAMRAESFTGYGGLKLVEVPRPRGKEGDRTLVPFLHPTWAERIKTDAPWLRPLPPGDIHQFAMMGVNPPTAYLLLTDIVKLPRRSWVIQNGANSGVGRATVAIAKSLGLRTVNVVRRDEVVAEMKGCNPFGCNSRVIVSP